MQENKIGKNTSLETLRRRQAENDKRIEADAPTLVPPVSPKASDKEAPTKTA